MLPEASLALADYIENGRPKAEGVDNVFIRHVHPFTAMSRALVVFKRYNEMAGITKTLGFHSLRRKLGKDLVRSGTPLEIVVEHDFLFPLQYMSAPRRRLLTGSIRTPAHGSPTLSGS
ncbi:MAG: tyrosine-type recombinase/integrase [Clostridiales bacterium]|nr:tyrosine-type recombinase/integrase [Clostridiales bacterium]